MRQLLSELRKHLDVAACDFVETGGDDISLNLRQVSIDVQARKPPAHYELLEGFDMDDPAFEEWLSEERAHWYDRLKTEDTPPSAPAIQKSKSTLRRWTPRILLADFATIGDDTVGHLAAGVVSEIVSMFGAISDMYELAHRGPDEDQQADYTLTGTVRQGNGFRITVQLIRQESRAIVWTEKYDVPSAAHFDAQEQVARNIVEAVQSVLNDSSQAGFRQIETVPTRAWELYQRARSLDQLGGRRRLNPTIAYYKEALSITPDFLAARVGLAFSYLDGLRNCWLDRTDEVLREVQNIATSLVKTDGENLWVCALTAFAACAEQQFTSGLGIMEDVVNEAPESPEFNGCMGAILDYCGRNDEGIKIHRHALTLSEYPPAWINTNLAMSLLIVKDPAALETAEGILARDAKNQRALMVKAVHCLRYGRMPQAEEAAETLRVLDPRLTAQTWRSPTFFADRSQHRAIAAELKKLGF
ncbi:hypothetical protein [Yoonia sp. 2307UL14-13]|uniref:hypothetical protein n=1 Tax=Yoonia sp. 2307UL14-13 TaxID=3126506 RepID=UPI0030A5ED53